MGARYSFRRCSNVHASKSRFFIPLLFPNTTQAQPLWLRGRHRTFLPCSNLHVFKTRPPIFYPSPCSNPHSSKPRFSVPPLFPNVPKAQPLWRRDRYRTFLPCSNPMCSKRERLFCFLESRPRSGNVQSPILLNLDFLFHLFFPTSRKRSLYGGEAVTGLFCRVQTPCVQNAIACFGLVAGRIQSALERMK